MSIKLNLNAPLDRRGFVAALGAAGALALAGCGSSKDGASASDAEAAYTLVEEGKIIVASDLANPPLDYVENNQNKGFEVELMEAVAEKLGLTCEYLPAMKFDAIIPLIKQGGKADVASPTSPSPTSARPRSTSPTPTWTPTRASSPAPTPRRTPPTP